MQIEAAPLLETHQQLLLRNLVGRIGREELARQLGVPASSIDQWIHGDAPMPNRKLVVLAQVVHKVLYPS
jgi:hypothetical protein